MAITLTSGIRLPAITMERSPIVAEARSARATRELTSCSEFPTPSAKDPAD